MEHELKETETLLCLNEDYSTAVCACEQLCFTTWEHCCAIRPTLPFSTSIKHFQASFSAQACKPVCRED